MTTAGLPGRSSVVKLSVDSASDVSHSLGTEDLEDDWDGLPQTHLRPTILRRETSQILSYYQSEDAGRSEPEYRYPTPNIDSITEPYARGRNKADTRHNRDARGLESRGVSPSSGYSDTSVSDYDPPKAERTLGMSERRSQQELKWNGDKGRYGSRNVEDGAGGETSTEVDVQYGIAIGSPSRNASPAVFDANTNTESETEMVRNGTKVTTDGILYTSTDVGTGYGSNPITDQFRPSHRRAVAPPHLNLPFDAPHLPRPFVQSKLQTQEQSADTNNLSRQLEPAPVAVSTVDSFSDPSHAPDGAPGLRRKMSSHGASDKRRVAVVQVDSETDVEHEGAAGGGGSGEKLSDGFGRGEAPDKQEQQQARAQYSVKPLPFSNSSPSYSSHPPSAFSANAGSKTTTASSLLARRGIVGTFAFLAPPDASPSAYTNLGYFTPPLSAPASAHPTPPLLVRHESAESSTSATSNTTASSSRRQHQRSQSEAVLTGAHSTINRASPKSDPDAISSESSSKGGKRRYGHRLRKSSRDIGIVGTSTAVSPTSGTMRTEVHLSDETKTHTANSSEHKPAQTAQLSPIFQTPSRSQTSLISSDGAAELGSDKTRAQSPPASNDSRRYSQQHTTNGSGHSNSIGNSAINNSTAYRSRREEHKPTGDRSDSSYMWHASNVSPSSVYSTNYASNGATSPSYSYYTMATTASSSSSPPTVLTMPVSAPSPYLYYQPGIHATAGPLPSPPRQIIPPKRDSPPPPRPPRLHAPNSGSSSLAKRRSDTSITSKQERASAPSPAVRQTEIASPTMTPSTTSSTLVNSQSEGSVKSMGHTREGAFPIDSVIVTDATHARLSMKQDQQEQQPLKRKNTMDDLVRDVTAAIDEATGLVQKTGATSAPAATASPGKKNEPSPPPKPKLLNLQERRSGMDLRREESRSTFKGGEPSSPASPNSTYSDDDNVADITVTKPLPDPRTTSPHSTHRTESQESGHVSRSQKMLDIAIKRFSALPRPPSRLSASRASPRSSVSHERPSQDRSDTGHSAGHGSHLGHEQQSSAPTRTRPVYVVKIRSVWPDAMYFADVMAKRTSNERSLGYARKINELANHDPGLGDWVATTKYNLTVPGKSSKRKSLSSGAVRSPSGNSFTFQPRQTSRGSIASEMTFPKRVDAYVATDLLPQRSEEDALPRGPPPTLPYPTLAQGPPPHQQQSMRLGISSSTRSNTSSLGSSKSTGGFFASIGRKASVKKDRPTISAPQPNKLLSKRQQTTPAVAPRPVQINVAPSLPGGPRAPPGRVQRAQSVIAPKSTPSESETDTARRRSIKRSPSVAPSLAQNGANQIPESSSDLDAKVSRLADLLPHADRKVLSGYLRRAGGMDMVAIGRYLDDEKNNRILIPE